MSKHEVDFITTYTGKKFHFLNPAEEEVCIQDIAHSLSLKCRFGGHCKEFYSVGEHSIRVAEILPDQLQLAGLLHDATEAYWPDVPRPIKEQFHLIEFENTLFDLLERKYGIRITKEIKEADNIIGLTEARDLMTDTDGWKDYPEKPLKQAIHPLPSGLVERLFLGYYRLRCYKDIFCTS